MCRPLAPLRAVTVLIAATLLASGCGGSDAASPAAPSTTPNSRHPMDEIGREVLESARRPCDREVPPPVGDDDPFEVTVTVDPDPQVDLERHALPQDPVATIVVTNTSDEVLYHHRSHALTLQDPDTNAIVSHGGGAVPADLPRGTEVPPGATSTERVSLALTACLEPGVDATTIGDPVTPGTYLAVGAVRVSPDPWGQGAITRSTPPVRVDID